MILTGLIMGATLLVGASALATFWNNIINWLKRVYKKLETVIKGVLHGSRIFMKKMGEAVKEISKNYSKVGTKWQETIVDKNIALNEVPDEYLNKMSVNNREYEFSDELEMQLHQ